MFRRFLRYLYIQVEPTPNEHALKFLPGQPVLSIENRHNPTEFLKVDEARSMSPLAANLLQIRGIRSVFFGPDFIAVNKRETADWRHLKPQVLAAITECIMKREPFIKGVEKLPNDESILPAEDDPEVVRKIKSILDEKIRPAVQGDGGDVEFRGFVNGWVRLKLQGACRSCASSVVTLRNGIENMLMYYVPEVKGVEEVEDDIDVASEEEFERVERDLSQREEKKD